MYSRLIVAATAALCWGAIAASAGSGDGLQGTWLVEDGSSKIRFEPCGADLCGRLVWLREPNDPETGQSMLDKNNPDEKLQARPLLGLVLFTGLKPSKPNQWAGQVYNADDGNNYEVTVKLAEPSRVEVEGCGLAGLVCQSEKWQRAD